MITISRQIFSTLHEEILKKCEAIEPKILGNRNKTTQLYGFGKYKETSTVHSIIDIIQEDSNVQAYLKTLNIDKNLSGKHLYRAHLEFSNPLCDSIKFRGVYEYVYFKFLGCDDLVSFIKLYIDREISPNLVVNYHCYRYSFKGHCVKSFNLSIDYNTAPFQGIVYNFHTKHSNKNDKVYSGNIEEKNRFLFAQLVAEDGNELNLIGILGTTNVISMDIIFGTIQVVTSTGFPTSAEVIITKLNKYKQKLITPIEEQNIFFYLMMKRNIYRVPQRVINSVDEIQASFHKLSEVKHLVGVYRIWSLKRDWSVVQSKFIIKEDFQAFLETPLAQNENQQKLVCVLRISDVNVMKLCVSAHEYYGTRIVDFAIIDFPSKTNPMYTKGVQCGVGIGRENQVQLSTTNHIVLMKEHNNTDFKACIYSSKDIKKIISISPNFNTLYNNLVEIIRRDKMNIY